MLFGDSIGGLEVRRRGDAITLSGRFPYESPAVLSDGGRRREEELALEKRQRGRPLKEVFAARAFSFRLDNPSEDIHLLIGHDYGKPLASRSAKSLDIRDGDEAVTFTAEIRDELRQAPYVQDAIGQLEAGLVGGISPGFRLAPARRVPQAVEISQEPIRPSEGMHGATIRRILAGAALLYEMSIVTRPAFPETQLAMRDWLCGEARGQIPVKNSRAARERAKIWAY